MSDPRQRIEFSVGPFNEIRLDDDRAVQMAVSDCGQAYGFWLTNQGHTIELAVTPEAWGAMKKLVEKSA